jgi:hypothetical protein
MKIRKFFKSKKAFSAIIASLILMLLAVAAGVIVYGYVMGWIGGTTQSPTRTGQMQFDSIFANATSTPGKIQMYVRNVGTSDLNVSSIYVAGSLVSNNTALTATSSVFTVQNVVYLEVNYTMVKNNFYIVAVTCKDGTTISQSVEAK